MKKQRKIIPLLCLIALYALLLCTVLPFLPWQIWVFDLFAHFQTYYFGLATAFLLCFIACLPFVKQTTLYKHCLFPIVCSLLFSGLSLMPYMPKAAPALPTDTAFLKVMQANVFKYNLDHKHFIQQIQDVQPDIIAISEATPKWKDALIDQKETWPYIIDKAKRGSHGMMILSKYPFTRHETQYLGSHNIPTIFFEVAWQEKDLRFISLHPLPPVCLACFRSRDENFTAIAKHIRKNSTQNTAFIVLGDMNTTMFSPSYKAMIKAAHLKNAREKTGVFPSWPANFPFFMRLPIDHILHNDKIDIMRFSTLPATNSDHLSTLAILR